MSTAHLRSLRTGAFVIAITCLFSTGHPGGAWFLIGYLAVSIFQED